jgi:hypothetical protein
MTNLPSPSEIASTGQPAAQAPQAMQESLIAYAIEIHLQIESILIIMKIAEKAISFQNSCESAKN